MGCCAFLQGIFRTQGSNLRLLLSPALAGRIFTASATWEAQAMSFLCSNLSVISHLTDGEIQSPYSGLQGPPRSPPPTLCLLLLSPLPPAPQASSWPTTLPLDILVTCFTTSLCLSTEPFLCLNKTAPPSSVLCPSLGSFFSLTRNSTRHSLYLFSYPSPHYQSSTRTKTVCSLLNPQGWKSAWHLKQSLSATYGGDHLQCIRASNQHTGHLKLTQCYMSIMLQ